MPPLCSGRLLHKVQAMDTTNQHRRDCQEQGPWAGLATRAWTDESAVTAIEYGLLASLIAVAIVGGLSATGDSVIAIFEYWSSAVITALGG